MPYDKTRGRNILQVRNTWLVIVLNKNTHYGRVANNFSNCFIFYLKNKIDIKLLTLTQKSFKKEKKLHQI